MNLKARIHIGLACLLLLFQLIIQINLAMTDAQTSDEAVHLFSGYTYLTSGNFRYNPEHPPLMKYIAAAPLLFLRPNIPPRAQDYNQQFNDPYFFGNREQFNIGSDFLYQTNNNSDQLLFDGRLMMIGITLLLGIAVYLIAVYFWGLVGGLIAVALYTADPLINGHGHLITNDVLVSLTSLLALFAFWLFLQKPTWSKTLLFGFLLGLAELSKFSALVLYPLTLVLLIGYVIWKRTGWRIFWNYLGKFAVAIIFVQFIIVAGYGFRLNLLPDEPSISQSVVSSNHLVPGVYESNQLIDNTFHYVRYILLPGDYYLGLAAFLTHADSGHLGYLFGQTSNTGWWYYFPVLFSAKTPLITLAIFTAAITYAFVKKKGRSVMVFLLVAVLFQFIFAMNSKVNIGLRHIMPVYPLLFIGAGVIGENIYLYILLGLLFLQSLYINPYQISFFNLLYGGTYNGYKTAVDSNLDWGQDGKRIQNYINDKKLKNVYLDYWSGNAEKFIPTSGHNLIIGATELFENQDYAWLKDKTPTARITPSVFLFSF